MPQALWFTFFFCLITPIHALRYEINAKAGKIWAIRESDKDTWESLLQEWEPVLDPKKITGKSGALAEKTALHELFHPFMREWINRNVEPSEEEREEIKIKGESAVNAPNCFSAVLSVYKAGWKPSYMDYPVFLKHFPSGTARKFSQISGSEEFKPGDVLLFYTTAENRYRDIGDNGQIITGKTTTESLDHTAIYLADGFVFEKENFRFFQPYKIASIEKAKDRMRHSTGATSKWLKTIEIWRPERKAIPKESKPPAPKKETKEPSQIFDGKNSFQDGATPPVRITVSPQDEKTPAQKDESKKVPEKPTLYPPVLPPSPEVKKALGLIKDAKAENRKQGIKILRTLGAKQHAADVAELLTDPDPWVRGWAAATLNDFGAKEHAGAIAQQLQDPDPIVRRTALYALGDIGASSYAKKIADMLQDSDFWVRKAAADALGALNARDQADALGTILEKDDEKEIVKLAALEALKKMKAKSALSSIRKLLAKHKESQIQPYTDLERKALDAIYEITKGALVEEKEKELRKNMRLYMAGAVKYLIEGQQPDGSWSSSREDHKLAGTCLALEALRNAKKHSIFLTPLDAEQVDKKIKRAELYIMERGVLIEKIEKSDDHRPIAFAMALESLAGMPDGKEKKETIEMYLDKLRQLKGKDGGYGYAARFHSTSFQTAQVMLSLLKLRRKYRHPDIDYLLEHAAASLKNSFKKEDSLLPYYAPWNHNWFDEQWNKDSAGPEGAAERSLVGAYALHCYDREVRKKPGTELMEKTIKNYLKSPDVSQKLIYAGEGNIEAHSGPSKSSDYFYLYNLMHITAAMKEAKRPDGRAFLEKAQMDVLKMPILKESGLWNTSRYTSMTQDTSMALLVLFETMDKEMASK